VPQKWRRLGHIQYAGLFGAFLGLGILTEIPSFGYVVVLCWSLASLSWHSIWPVAITFALARFMPVLGVALIEMRAPVVPFRSLQIASAAATILVTLETTLLMAFAVVFLI
jgi:hypothetical protein